MSVEEPYNEINIIKKYYNFKNVESKKLDDDEEDKIINLLVFFKHKIETEVNEKYEYNTDEENKIKNILINYVKSLKILIFYIPFNNSIKKKITEKGIYKLLFLGMYNNQGDRYQNKFNDNILFYNNSNDELRNNKCQNIECENIIFSSYKAEIDKYELIFLINLITHNENNIEIFKYLYPFYFYYIILFEKQEKDTIFMLLNNFIINEESYIYISQKEDFSFLIFLSVLDCLKNIKNKAIICNYFYVFIENSLKNECKLFIHIYETLRNLYVNFYTYCLKLKDHNFPFEKIKLKIFTKKDNKYYLLKYISLMCRLLLETLYNILDSKNLDIEKIDVYKNLYKMIMNEIKDNINYINTVNYFDKYDDTHILKYYKNVLFMDVFIYHKKKIIIENFKLILFISNIFSDRYEQLDDFSCNDKISFINIIFTYLKIIYEKRSDSIEKKQQIIYHNFVLNRYIISVVANFSLDNTVSRYIRRNNGLDLLRKFMYIDDKDPCLSEYSILAIKHIKENENLDDL
ncbi:conserved Plasmodium protein, unknown function [Plasmodium gaboni]|uniref:Uncharacterized protein n=1 Tax=Plasmodium gaboni TaxID=647221 RepID=A0ABY1UU47_9APIC|nr:conserved Plasmodium protein, unknown function [Plasmodium gaboni]